MKRLKQLWRIFVYSVSFGIAWAPNATWASGAAAIGPQPVRLYGDGMPLPWPFPWAEECPVDWMSLQGLYLLSESETGEYIDLRISVLEIMDIQIVRMSRFTRMGEMVSDGYTRVEEGQKSLALDLIPVKHGEANIHAILQLHFVSNVRSCTEDALVPILTFKTGSSTTSTETQYRLVRMLKRGTEP